MTNTSRQLSLITAVLVTRNHAGTIGRVLAALPRKLGQVLVIDNGGTDRTLHYIREHFPHVQILKNGQDEGLGFALNRGLRVAETPYVLLLNPKVMIDEAAILTLLQKLEADVTCDGVAPLIYSGRTLLPNFKRGFGREYAQQKLYTPSGDLCADHVTPDCLLLNLTYIRRYRNGFDPVLKTRIAFESFAYAVMQSEGALCVTPAARAEWLGRTRQWDQPRDRIEAWHYGWDDAFLHHAYDLKGGSVPELWQRAFGSLMLACGWMIVLQPWHAMPYFAQARGMLAYLWGQERRRIRW